MPEVGWCSVTAVNFLYGTQPGHRLLVQVARLLEVAAAKAQPQHRMAHRPIPLIVNGQPLKQRLVALKQFLERIEKQALAKPTRAR